MGRLVRSALAVELPALPLPFAVPFTAVVVVVAALMLLLFPVMTLLLSPTMLLLPVIVVPPDTNPGRKISTSLIAVAVALLVLVLVLLDDALGALAVEVGVLPVGVVLPGAAVVCTGALVPAAAVPEPLTVDAFTVVDPEVSTLPEPLFVPVTVVEPDALVTALVGLVGAGVLVTLLSTGAAVPLAATPEPLTVAALTVVEPAAFMAPLPLLVALTVVEPDALVIAVWAAAGTLLKPSSAALTAAATRFPGGCDFLIVISRHSFPLDQVRLSLRHQSDPRNISRGLP